MIGGATDETELSALLPQADAIMVFHDISRLGEASFAQAPRCRGVVRAGVGYNNIDVEAATRHGVVVCNVPDYGTEEVADHAIMFLLALVRRLIACHLTVQSGTWHYETALGAPRLRGKTLGLVGCGRIGTATALRAKALGLDVAFFDPFLRQGMDKALGIRRVYQLEELLEQSHFVSLHCYLDETTHHLLNARTLARMRPGAFLINTARGPIVDQNALLLALDAGHIAGAAARRRRARTARRPANQSAPAHPADAPHGVLHCRRLRRAQNQDGRGSQANSPGSAASKRGQRSSKRSRLIDSLVARKIGPY